MSSEQFMQRVQHQIHIYERLPLSVILFFPSAKFCYSNAQASGRFPDLCSFSAVESLLSQHKTAELHDKLRADGSVPLTCVFEEQLLSLHILPIFHGDEIEGLRLYFLDKPSDLTPEQKAVTAQMTSQLNSAVRESIGEIFDTIDSLNQKAEHLQPLSAPLSTNSYRILRTVNNLSLYLNLENKLYLPQYSMQDFAEDLEDMTKPVSEIAQNMNIPVQFSLPDTACPLYADHRLLQQALFQLVHNSLYFTRPGNAIEVKLCRSEGALTLSVQDKGLGIAPDLLEKVWEPYASFDPTRRGMGLGLSLVKLIAQLHNGEVHLQSALGEGTTVTLSLPVKTTNLLSFAQNLYPIQPHEPFSDLFIGLTDASLSPFHQYVE